MLQLEFLPVITRCIRTRHDLLKPDLAKNVNHRQAVQKTHHDLHAKALVLDVGQRVMVRNFGKGLKWLPGALSQQHSPATFELKLEDTRLWKRHTDQLKLQELDHSREPKGRLPSDGEVNYDPDIPLSLEEHSPAPIMASQLPLTFITPMTLRWCLHSIFY